MVLVFHPRTLKPAVLQRIAVRCFAVTLLCAAAWATAQDGGGRTEHPAVDPAGVPQAHVEPRTMHP
jgi:hypothetical protein